MLRIEPLFGVSTKGFNRGREVKRGDLYFRALVERGGRDGEGPCRVRIDPFILRSIRKGWAFLTLKNDQTWVRHGVGKGAKWGWAPSIPGCYRNGFEIGDGTRSGFGRSEQGAVRLAIKRLRGTRKYWVGQCSDSVRSVDQEIACLERWQARHARDSDGTATAALCEDIAVPQDCQARAEGIAQPTPVSDPISNKGER